MIEIVPNPQPPDFLSLLHKWFVSRNLFGLQIFHQHSSFMHFGNFSGKGKE